MSGLTVLVTGVTRFIGSELAGRLAADPRIEKVIGVDAALPDSAALARMGGAEFTRVDIRSPVISTLIETAGFDTVVHASASATPSGSAAKSMAKEMNVLGTMQLLAACQRSTTVKNLIVRSTAAVYGGSSRDPAVIDEDASTRGMPSTGIARDAVDIEGFVRGFGRRRPDVRIAVPRFADIIGPTVRTPLTAYFSLSPFVPVLAGRDARLQLVHEQDAVGLMEHLVMGDFAGTVNVAGAGVLTVGQAIHLAGRLPLPLPAGALGGIGRALRLLQVDGYSPAQIRQLATGRVVDTSRLRDQVGFVPAYSTRAAFDDFVARLRPAIPATAVRGVERQLAAALGVEPLSDGGRTNSRPAAGPATRTTVRPVDQPAVRSIDQPTAQSTPGGTGRRAAGTSPGTRPHLFSIDGQAAGRPVRPGGRQR